MGTPAALGVTAWTGETQVAQRWCDNGSSTDDDQGNLTVMSSARLELAEQYLGKQLPHESAGTSCNQRTSKFSRWEVVGARHQVRARMHRGTWLGRWQGTIDAWNEERCEEPHGCGGPAEERGVEGIPVVGWQQVLSQLGRKKEHV